IGVYCDAHTSGMMHARFGFCFATPPGSQYPPILTEHRLVADTSVTIEGEGGPVEALSFVQRHGENVVLGFRFSGLCYSCVVTGFSDRALAALQGRDVWILDALRYRPHPSHFSVEEALGWIERLRPRRAILTNMHTDIDFETLRKALPAGVEPAYDG